MHFPQILLYSWNQIEGPKINLTEEDKRNKILKFIAPNYPVDTKYAFEVKVVQKKPNGSIVLGKDRINFLVIDTNKIAKGASMNIFFFALKFFIIINTTTITAQHSKK